MNHIDIEEFNARFQIKETPLSIPENGGFPIVENAQDLVKEIPVSVKLLPLGAKTRCQPTGSLEKRINSVVHPHLLNCRERYRVVALEKPGEKESKKEPKPLFDAWIYDYIEGGNLATYSQKGLTVRDKERIIDGILEGLQALHKQKIIHGNIKPGNILIQNVGHPHVRLVDFGLAPEQKFENLNVNFPAGSIAYVAPELLSPDEYSSNARPGYTVDFWSLGLIVYELFTGKYLFGAKSSSNADLAARICLMDIPQSMDKIPYPYRLVAERCLQRSPTDRPKSVKAIYALLDPQKQTNPFRSIGSKAGKATQAEKIESSESGPSFSRLFAKKKPKSAKIICRTCGTANDPTKVTCHKCKQALRGPNSLRYFRSPTKIGNWAVIFFSLLLVPIAFFYTSIYEMCDFSNGDCNVAEHVVSLINGFKSSGSGEEALALLTVPLVFMFLSGLLFFIFYYWWLWRSSANLGKLGSLKRKYHPLLLAGINLLTILTFPGVISSSGKAILFIGLLVIGQAILSLLTLQEIWKGSDSSFLQTGISWKQAKSSFLIFSRWALSFIFPVLLFLPFLSFSVNLQVSQAWFFFWVGMIALYWLLTILVIVRINMRQRAKYLALANT